MVDQGAASTGVAALDAALDGLYWGDNVVWESEDPTAVEPFYGALAGQRGDYDGAAFVSLTRPPEEVRAAYPGFEVVDARAGGSLGRPAPLLQAIYERCDAAPRTLLLFDPLDAMAERWGTDTARTFFVRCCPHLLEVGAIAYWAVGHGAALAQLRRDIAEVTQCVFTVSDGRLRIAKAEARGPGVEGSVFRTRIEDGRPTVEAAPAAARVGTALRAVRMQRQLSQSDLARLLRISPSAVSQAERGRRGLSLETLLEACAKLDLTLDELLRGDVHPGYRLARRHHSLRHPPRSAPLCGCLPLALGRRPPRGPARLPRHARAARAGPAAPQPQGRGARRGRQRARPGAARGRAAGAAPRRDAPRGAHRGPRLAQPRRSRGDAVLDPARRLTSAAGGRGFDRGPGSAAHAGGGVR